MFFFGVNAIIQKKAQNIEPITLTLIVLATATFITFIYWLFFHTNKIHSPEGIALAVLSGIVYVVAFLLFIVALRSGKASIVVTINALGAIVAVTLALLFLSEKLTLMKLIGILLGIIAAVIISIK